MGKMMLTEQYFLFADAELSLESCTNPKFVDHPRNHGLTKYCPRLAISLEGGHQNAIEFAERLLKEDDVVQILPIDSGLIQAESNCMFWKAVVVLELRESLFFCRRDEYSIAQQCCRGIMVVTRNPEYVHLSLPFGPLVIVGFIRMFEPFGGPTFDS